MILTKGRWRDISLATATAGIICSSAGALPRLLPRGRDTCIDIESEPFGLIHALPPLPVNMIQERYYITRYHNM